MKSDTIEIRLLGQKIVLKSGGDPEAIRDVMDLVTSKLNEAETRSRSVVPHHVALLALLDLAEEYLQAKKRASDHQKRVEEKSSHLISLLETELK